MQDITGKIEEFRIGHIKNDSSLILYDTQLHLDYYNIINDYWTDKTQYYYSLLTESDLTAFIPPAPTPFNISSYNLTSGDLTTITGIDFETAYGITGDLVSGFINNLNTITSLLTSSINSFSNISTLTSNIPVQGKTPSDGVISIIKTNLDFLDRNDMQTYYSTNLDIVFTAEKISSRTDLKTQILDKILKKGKLISKRLITCFNTDLLYCKHPDTIIEQICIEVLGTILTYQKSLNIAKALNSIMPSNDYINNNHSNLELLKTTKALIDEIDIIRQAIKYKGWNI